MSTPRASVPNWATQATVTAGHPDAGLSSRLEPSANQKASGHVGGTNTAARVENWRAGSAGDWLSYLSPIQMRNWVKQNPYEVQDTWPGGMLLNPMAVHLRGWSFPGTYTAGAGALLLNTPQCLTALGKSSKANTRRIASGAGSLYGVSAATNGSTIVVGIKTTSETNTFVWLLDPSDYSANYTPQLSALAGNAGKVVCADVGANGRYVAFDSRVGGWQNGKYIYSSDDGGSVWGSQTIANSAGAKTISCAVASGNFLAVGMIGHNSVMTAPANTLVWTETLLPGGEFTVGLARGYLCWFALSQTGKLYRKADASTAWSLVSTVGSDTPRPSTSFADTATAEGNFLACDGSRALVVPFRTGMGHGVYWSLDEGVTWGKQWLAQYWGEFYAPVPRGVSFADGEFVYLVREANEEDNALKDAIYTSLRL